MQSMLKWEIYLEDWQLAGCTTSSQLRAYDARNYLKRWLQLMKTGELS